MEAIVPLKIYKNLTYRVPESLNDQVEIGKRITIPIGKSKIYTGLICAISEKPPKEYEAKYLFDILDDTPILSQDNLELWYWIASYYLCTLGEVMRNALPAGLKLEGESVVVFNPHYDGEFQDLDATEQIIISHLQKKEKLKINEINNICDSKNTWKYIHSLYTKGMLVMQEDIDEMYHKKYQQMVYIHPDIQNDLGLSEIFNELEKRSPKQLETIMFIISKVGIKGMLLKSEVITQTNSLSALNSMVEKGYLVIEKIEISRLKDYGQGQENTQLTDSQNTAYLAIKQYFEKEKTVLLHGVTSSGKTHIYLQLIEEHLKEGRQILYLLPEIALTSNLVRRLQYYFGEYLIVSHSKFSVNERVEIYKEISIGKPLLIVGTRSSIFLPFKNLGLIIVDEEHDSSFKQSQTKPYFNARDVSVWMGAQMKINVLLGSATPSIESYYNAITSKYCLVGLNQKFGASQQNNWHIINMAEKRKSKKVFGPFSDELLHAIQELKEDKKQSIIFQNRKGFVPFFECKDCGWIPKCINCDISLTYYKTKNHLRCNYCGHTKGIVEQCVTCKSTDIQMIGYGTERIAEDLKLYLPQIEVDRLDRESTTTQNSQERILRNFDQGKTDVIVGTQLITKGLDFENVDLVAIPYLDLLLNFPDFRSNERTFQLVLQVAGRTGRREKPGSVYLQTLRPDHPIISKLVQEDYVAFFNQELLEREKFQYPPFERLIKIEIKHKDALFLTKGGHFLKRNLENALKTKVLGPEKPHVSFVRNQFVLQLLIKIKNQHHILKPLKEKLQSTLIGIENSTHLKGIRILLDVDPI